MNVQGKMHYYPRAGEFTTTTADGTEEKDIFSIEVDGDVKVGQVKIKPVNDAPVPEEPGQITFPKSAIGEPALLANKLTNWTFEKVVNDPKFGASYYYRGKLGPQKDVDGDTLRYTITREPKLGELRLLCTGRTPAQVRSCGADNSAFEYVPFGNNSGLPDYFDFRVDDDPAGGHNNADRSLVVGTRPLYYT